MTHQNTAAPRRAARAEGSRGAGIVALASVTLVPRPCGLHFTVATAGPSLAMTGHAKTMTARNTGLRGQ